MKFTLLFLALVAAFSAANARSVGHGSSALHPLLQPIALIDISDIADSPALLEEGSTKWKNCGNKMACPLRSGVCCSDQKTCCAERCKPEGGCGLSPEHQAIAVAKMKLELEAKQQIKSEQHAKAKSEEGKKRLAEQLAKSQQEQQLKRKEKAGEQQQKKLETQAEAANKQKEVAQEQLNKEKAKKDLESASEQGKKKQDELMRKQQEESDKRKVEQDTKSALERDKISSTLKSGRFAISRAHIISNTFSAPSAATFSFWINPRARSGAETSILHKGQTDAERAPAINFNPNTLEMFVHTTSGRGLKQELPAEVWTHIAVSHGNNQLLMYVNGTQRHQTTTEYRANSGPVYAGSPWKEAANAQMADARAWSSVRSAADIKQLFQAGVPS